MGESCLAGYLSHLGNHLHYPRFWSRWGKVVEEVDFHGLVGRVGQVGQNFRTFPDEGGDNWYMIFPVWRIGSSCIYRFDCNDSSKAFWLSLSASNIMSLYSVPFGQLPSMKLWSNCSIV